MLDPGPDFAKTPAQTVAVLRASTRLHALGRPLLLAVSRKDFLGAITGRPPAERLAGTLAARAGGVDAGARASCACTTSPPRPTSSRSRPSSRARSGAGVRRGRRGAEVDRAADTAGPLPERYRLARVAGRCRNAAGCPPTTSPRRTPCPSCSPRRPRGQPARRPARDRLGARHRRLPPPAQGRADRRDPRRQVRRLRRADPRPPRSARAPRAPRRPRPRRAGTPPTSEAEAAPRRAVAAAATSSTRPPRSRRAPAAPRAAAPARDAGPLDEADRAAATAADRAATRPTADAATRRRGRRRAARQRLGLRARVAAASPPTTTSTSPPPRCAAASSSPATASPARCAAARARSATRRSCASTPSTARRPRRSPRARRYDELPCTFPSERLELGSDDPTLKAIEWLTPIGRGSRVTVIGPAPAPARPRRCAASPPRWPASGRLELHVVLAGVRPEEVAEWQAARAADRRPRRSPPRPTRRRRPLERAIEPARSVAARGGHAVVLVDTLEQRARRPSPAGRWPRRATSRRRLADRHRDGRGAARRRDDGHRPRRVADATERRPVVAAAASGTLRPELLVGARAPTITKARAKALAVAEWPPARGSLRAVHRSGHRWPPPTPGGRFRRGGGARRHAHR